MDINSNSLEKMKKDFVKRKSEEEEEEENLNSEIQTDNLTARFKRDSKMDIISNSLEKMKEEEENLNFEIQTDNLTARFKLEKQLNCSEEEEEEEEEKTDTDTRKFNLGIDLNCSKKHEKNDSDTRKSDDLNCSEKRSSTVMEEEEEERMKWRIEDEEYVCYLCGMRGSKFLDRGSKFLDHSFGNQLQDAHRYCVLKEIKNKSLEANDESLGARRVELHDFFKILNDTSTSLIDHLVQTFGRNSSD